jgi:transposase
VVEQRANWHEQLKNVPLDQIVVIDESAAMTNMTRLRGRCDKSERLVAPVPQGHWKVLTMIGAMTIKGVLAAVTVDAATDGEIFCHFVTDALVPVLRPGDVVVMDNLQAHKAVGIRTAIEAVGARLLYLPPYSPDLSPIEPMWSKVKQKLRSIAARTVDGLRGAVTTALQSITQNDCQGFFRHCGYTLRET